MEIASRREPASDEVYTLIYVANLTVLLMSCSSLVGSRTEILRLILTDVSIGCIESGV